MIETHRGRGYRIALPIVPLSPIETASPTDQGRTSPQATAVVSTGKTAARALKPPVPMGFAAAAVLLFLFLAYHVITVRTARAHPSIQSILFEQSGGTDPLDAGFKLVRPDEGYRHIVRNPDNTGFDRWRVTTDDQNFYYRKLIDSEKEFAVRHDWKLTCVCALEKGAGTSDVDLGPGIGPRFDIAYLQEGAKYFVVLTRQISPQYEFDQKIEFPGLADVDHPHTYELRYDHLTQTASLWIDGQLRASGYRGHRQYQENYGFMFGAATYREVKQSSMVFRSVRFEAR